MELRFLNKNNKTDVDNLQVLLHEYCNTQEHKVNPTVSVDSSKRYCEWLLAEFLKRDQKDFIVSARFDNNVITQIMIAYKLEVAWHREIIEDVLPFWYIGLLYFKDIQWRGPADDILTIEKLATDHFEAQKYNRGFMTIKCPTGLVNDDRDITKYIDKVFTRTIPALRHRFCIERVFKTQQDIDNYKFKAFKPLIPPKIEKPVVLLSFELNYELRKSW